MNKIDEKYQELCNQNSDINEHLPTLARYASQCKHVTEMGVRGIVSTWALLKGSPETIISYDIQDPSHWGGNLQEVYDGASEVGINFKFIKNNVLDINIEKTDMLFIDTWHVYDQLKQELELHSSKVNKYICFHDTYSFRNHGESPGYKGIWPAIEEFLENNKQWEMVEDFSNNNGFTILGKKTKTKKNEKNTSSNSKL